MIWKRGNLIIDSTIKVDRIFSVSKKLVKMNIGRINKDTFDRIKRIVIEIIE
jgi:hypothetical protein